MITDAVIKDIYKKFRKPAKRLEELNLDYYVDMLRPHHGIKITPEEIVFTDLEEFNPFRSFLLRGLHTVLEFDRMVAFVFNRHILFLGKEDDKIQIHIKPEKESGSLFSKLFKK